MLENNFEFNFRLAAQEDEMDILKFYRSIIGTEGCTWNEEYPSILNIKDDIKINSLYCLTDRKDKIIAVAAAGPMDELNDLRWDERMTKPCELARIGVLPSMHNTGIASRLLNAVIEDCKKRGFNGMRFLVSKTNFNALKLYRKFGFMEAGEAFMYGHDFYCYYKILD